MKLVILTRDLGLGGVERCVALVSEGLAARGVSVEIVMLGGQRNLWGKHLSGIRVHDLSTIWHGKKPWTWFAGWRAVHRIVADADVVLAATFLMPLYMGWLATRFSKKKEIVASDSTARKASSEPRDSTNGTARDERETCQRHAAQEAGGSRSRFLGWIHGPLAELDTFARMNPIHRTACQFIYRRMDELVCVSEHSRQSLARWLDIAAKPSWRVLPNFVEPAAPRAAYSPSPYAEQSCGLHATSPVKREGAECAADEAFPPSPACGSGAGGKGCPLQLLFVGRIAVEKQPHLWLDTLEALAARGFSAELTVLGEGPLKEWVEAEASRRELTVHILGHIGGVEDYMRQADWLLLTSNFEGFGLVVLEAMQVGLPVVTTNSGGVCDFFAGRQDEFVTSKACGEALAALIEAQLPHYLEVADWCVRRAQDYAPGRMLDQWERLLR